MVRELVNETMIHLERQMGVLLVKLRGCTMETPKEPWLVFQNQNVSETVSRLNLGWLTTFQTVNQMTKMDYEMKIPTVP